MGLNQIKSKVMQRSRAHKIDHFYSLCPDKCRVLDVGVSAESGRGLPQRNYFLKNFRFPSEYYTGLGVHDLSTMSQIFPGKQFVQYEGGMFPFETDEFDWVFSNAVIEHVGDRENQVGFVNEMLRVAKKVFFTTPNKYFPIESHTNVFFMHWNDALFYSWCEKYRSWVTPENLNLLSHKSLEKILRASRARSYEIIPNRLIGLAMTYTVICEK